MNVTEKLESIELKVRQLALQMTRLQDENAALIAENKKLKTALDRQVGTVGVLKNKLELTQQALSQGKQKNSNGELKARIDQHIAEIDKCIEWLHDHC